jgi:hypothetical protein
VAAEAATPEMKNWLILLNGVPTNMKTDCMLRKKAVPPYSAGARLIDNQTTHFQDPGPWLQAIQKA